MKNYTLEELQGNLEGILRDAVIADEFATVQIDKELKAVIVSEAEWNILREGFIHLIGGSKIMK